jgi:hypothetical protein
VIGNWRIQAPEKIEENRNKFQVFGEGYDNHKHLDVVKRAQAVLAQPPASNLDKDLLQDGTAADAEAEDKLQGWWVSFSCCAFDFPKLYTYHSLATNQSQGLIFSPDSPGRQCHKLHQDPQINSEFFQFFPKTICTGFRSWDHGTYPCQVAA